MQTLTYLSDDHLSNRYAQNKASHILSIATLLRPCALNYLGSIRAIYYLRNIELAAGSHIRLEVKHPGNSQAVHEYQAFFPLTKSLPLMGNTHQAMI